MGDSQLMTNLLIIIVTFFFAAFFVASEFALVQSRVSALEERKKESKRSKKLPRVKR